jgi:hypothetical protein
MSRIVKDLRALRRGAPMLLMAIVLSAPARVGATLIDWEDGTWVHGGVTQTGYLAGSLSGTTNAGTVTVTWANFGTSTGYYASMGGTQPRVRTDFNGISDDGALAFGTSGGRNTVASGVVNYSQMIITFSTPVNINSFIIGDVDRSSPATGSGSWEDFLYVEGRLGGPAGTLRSTLYTTSPAYNTIATYLGLYGVRGNSSDASSTTDVANVGVAFDQEVTYIRLLYFQGPGVPGSGNHRIWFRDLDYSVDLSTPEPSTFLLAGIGLAALGLAARKRRR